MRVVMSAEGGARLRLTLCLALTVLLACGCGNLQLTPFVPELDATPAPAYLPGLTPPPAPATHGGTPTPASSPPAIPTRAASATFATTPKATSTPRPSPTLAPAISSGVTIYVDGSLAADCEGTSYSTAARTCGGADGTAVRSVNAALGGAADGDTILVRQGVYLETGHGRTQEDISYFIDKQVVLKTFQRETVTLSFPPGRYPGWKRGVPLGLMSITAPNVTLDGFTIVGTKAVSDSPGDQDVSISIDGTAGNVVIRNNHILEFGHAGIKPRNWGNGPMLIENNEFAGGFTTRDHGIYSTANDEHLKTIRYNYFHDISGYGIQVWAGNTDVCPDNTKPRNHEIYGNIFVRNHGGGIVLGGPYNKVLNNVFYGNDGVGGGLYLDRGGAHHLTVRNNIFWNNPITNILVESSCAVGNDFGYNDIGPGPLTARFLTYYNSTTDRSAEPQFVAAAPQLWADFRLKPSSPLANAGRNPGAPYNLILDPAASDRLGVLIGSNGGWPIGAFAASQ